MNEGTATHLADVAQVVGVPMTLPALEQLPTVDVRACRPLKSRRQETWLMMLLGAGFGLGVALTLSRLLAGLTPRLNPALEVAGAVACVAIGLAVTFVVVNLRGAAARPRAAGPLGGRGDVVAAVGGRGVGRHPGAGRRVGAEHRAGRRTTRPRTREVADQVSAIDSELREHAIAAARAAAVRDREMPTVQAALDAVRAELGDPGIPPAETEEDAARRNGNRSRSVQ